MLVHSQKSLQKFCKVSFCHNSINFAFFLAFLFFYLFFFFPKLSSFYLRSSIHSMYNHCTLSSTRPGILVFVYLPHKHTSDPISQSRPYCVVSPKSESFNLFLPFFIVLPALFSSTTATSFMPSFVFFCARLIFCLSSFIF